MDVAHSLTQAELEIQTAIESFQRATRLRLFDFFRPGGRVSEEAHVEHGLSALLRAERHVTTVTGVMTRLADTHPAQPLGARVAKLDDRMRDVMAGLRDHPDPRHLITRLKKAQKAIPAPRERSLGGELVVHDFS